jgi:hypothetical protein
MMAWAWPKTRACSPWPTLLLQQAVAGHAQSRAKAAALWLFSTTRRPLGKRPRRVIAKAEPSAKGRNPRFAVPSLQGEAQALYDDIYGARGEMEN